MNVPAITKYLPVSTLKKENTFLEVVPKKYSTPETGIKIHPTISSVAQATPSTSKNTPKTSTYFLIKILLSKVILRIEAIKRNAQMQLRTFLTPTVGRKKQLLP